MFVPWLGNISLLKELVIVTGKKVHITRCSLLVKWTLDAADKPGSHLDVNLRKVTQGLAAQDGFSLVHMES